MIFMKTLTSIMRKDPDEYEFSDREKFDNGRSKVGGVTSFLNPLSQLAKQAKIVGNETFKNVKSLGDKVSKFNRFVDFAEGVNAIQNAETSEECLEGLLQTSQIIPYNSVYTGYMTSKHMDILHGPQQYTSGEKQKKESRAWLKENKLAIGSSLTNIPSGVSFAVGGLGKAIIDRQDLNRPEILLRQAKESKEYYKKNLKPQLPSYTLTLIDRIQNSYKEYKGQKKNILDDVYSKELISRKKKQKHLGWFDTQNEVFKKLLTSSFVQKRGASSLVRSALDPEIKKIESLHIQSDKEYVKNNLHAYSNTSEHLVLARVRDKRAQEQVKRKKQFNMQGMYHIPQAAFSSEADAIKNTPNRLAY